MQLQNHKSVKRIIPGILLLSLFISQPSIAGIQNNYQKPASGSGSGYASIDTSKLNFYIKKGNESIKKNWFKPEIAKAYIDSATNLCEKGGFEIPSELHFLTAKYSFEAGDFSEVEEEMMLAETMAEEGKNYNTLTKILLFKGLYSLRTGFFKESNDAYMKSIELAKKWKISGIIQSGYFGIANVMNAAGDLKGYRTNLGYSIDAASAEKDTTGIEEGLLRLGSSYIEKERDFHKVDSLLKKCLEISIIRKDTFYTGYSSANIGYNYYLEKDYEPSLYYYKMSLDYSMAGHQIGISANSLGNIGTIYRDLGKLPKSHQLLPEINKPGKKGKRLV